MDMVGFGVRSDLGNVDHGRLTDSGLETEGKEECPHEFPLSCRRMSRTTTRAASRTVAVKTTSPTRPTRRGRKSLIGVLSSLWAVIHVLSAQPNERMMTRAATAWVSAGTMFGSIN
jgi:hypothetical protein